MAGPTDFLSPFLAVQQPTPVQAFAQGQQVGTGLLNAQVLGEDRARTAVQWQQAQQDRQAALAAQEAAKQAAAAQAAKKAELDAQVLALQQQFAQTKDPAIAMAIAGLRPDLAEPMKKTYEMASEAQKRDYADAAATGYNLLDAGQNDLAREAFEGRRQAFEAAGDKRQADAMANMVKLIDNNPEAAQGMLAMWLGTNAPQALEGKLKGATMASEVEKAKADAGKATSEAKIKEIQARYEDRKQKAALAKLYSDMKIAAERLGLDRQDLALRAMELDDKIQSRATGPLPENINKEVTDLATKATEMGATAGQMEALAQNFLDQGKGVGGAVATFVQTGATGRVTGAVGEQMGVTTDLSELRKQYIGMKSKAAAVANAGQGQMSNADRDALTADWITKLDAARPEDIARDLARRAEVMRRVEARSALVAEFKVLNRGNQPTKTDLVLSDGTMVPAGTSIATLGSVLEAKAKNDAMFGVK